MENEEGWGGRTDGRVRARGKIQTGKTRLTQRSPITWGGGGDQRR
jgi:hypothetical protein